MSLVKLIQAVQAEIGELSEVRTVYPASSDLFVPNWVKLPAVGVRLDGGPRKLQAGSTVEMVQTIRVVLVSDLSKHNDIVEMLERSELVAQMLDGNLLEGRDLDQPLHEAVWSSVSGVDTFIDDRRVLLWSAVDITYTWEENRS